MGEPSDSISLKSSSQKNDSSSRVSEVVKPKKTFKELWPKIWPMIFFLVIGICNAIFMKLVFIFEAVGVPEYGVHKFQKPWFVTMIQFFGMACAVIPYLGMLIYDKLHGNKKLVHLTDLSFKNFAEFAIPALVDVFENIVSSVCVVFVSVSIDSMMKSGTLVGVSLISRWIFKVRFPWYKWIAIIFVVIALTMVGAAGIINADESSTVTTSRLWVAVIIILKFVSQVGYAIRISYEEFFARVRGYHPVMICGLEGCWSTFISAFIFMPISYYLPGPEGNGIHEDSIDTLLMIGNSVPILLLVLFLCFISGTVYNITSATLISRTSAVVRTLMEAFRTFLIWIVSFIIFYSFEKSETLYQYRMAGEEWATGSYIQLAGFVIMTWAVFMYNKIPKYPCFNYNKIDPKDVSTEDNEEDAYNNVETAKVNVAPANDISEIETNTAQNDEITVDRDLDDNENMDSDVSVRSMSIGSSDDSDDTENPKKKK